MTAIPLDWLTGLAGGLMIGLAAALLLLGNGRVMGASGIVGSLVERPGASQTLGESLPFVAALIGAPALVVAIGGAPATHVTGDTGILLLAGLLVGVGTRLANGCTSGHGVVGMARLSPRSILATLTFLGAGFAVMFLGRHIVGVF